MRREFTNAFIDDERTNLGSKDNGPALNVVQGGLVEGKGLVEGCKYSLAHAVGGFCEVEGVNTMRISGGAEEYNALANLRRKVVEPRRGMG